MQTVKNYYRLMKPGVLYGNVLTGLAGFLLACGQGKIDWLLLVVTIVGMSLVVGGACALNNYLDRDIDQKMKRTKTRPSVTGELSHVGMQIFAYGVTLLGLVILALRTNWLVVIVGVLGFVIYVWAYGVWSKRKSVHGTIVGSISGALPIVGGYVAVTDRFDVGTLILFLIMFFWQFPEFYSIAIYRKKEYAAAHVPVISVSLGIDEAKKQIFVYTILYVVSTLCLTFFGYTGWVYFAVMLVSGGYWIWLASKAFKAKVAEAWARKMFRFSMYDVLLLVVMLSIGARLP